MRSTNQTALVQGRARIGIEDIGRQSGGAGCSTLRDITRSIDRGGFRPRPFARFPARGINRLGASAAKGSLSPHPLHSTRPLPGGVSRAVNRPHLKTRSFRQPGRFRMRRTRGDPVAVRYSQSPAWQLTTARCGGGPNRRRLRLTPPCTCESIITRRGDTDDISLGLDAARGRNI